MAISMTNWVSAASTTIGSGVSDRELRLMVFTDSNAAKTAGMPEDTVVEFTDSDAVLNYFNDVSCEEYIIAKNYFSYTSLTSTKPMSIAFWRIAESGGGGSGESGDDADGDDRSADTYVDALRKAKNSNDNFGTFFFVNAAQIAEVTQDPETKEWSAQDKDGNPIPYNNTAQAIAGWVDEQNFRFRYIQKVDIENIAQQRSSILWDEFVAPEGTKTIWNDTETYIRSVKREGVTLVLDDAFVNGGVSTRPEWLTAAMLAATRYERTNSTIIQEFKALNDASMNVTCDCDSLYGILCKYNINSYVRTQKAGQYVDFYSPGYNVDGTDTSVYDNEMWLKDRIASEVFNTYLRTNKIPAGIIGTSMIRSAIVNVITEGLNNLAILPEKEIEDSVKTAIAINTGSTDAPAAIYQQGWWLGVQDGMENTASGATLRKVDYLFYYSTGEGIRKVTGSHVLV